MMQQKEVLRKEHETTEKIAAHAFAQSYLADLVPTVFGTLSDNGYFYDPVERGKVFQLQWYIVVSCVEIDLFPCLCLSRLCPVWIIECWQSIHSSVVIW